MFPPTDDTIEPAITRRQFSIAVRALYPGCPQYHRGALVKRFKRKPRQGRLLQVVAVVVENWVRHNLTPYERLLYAPGDNPSQRATARNTVAARVAAILASWQAGSAAEDPAYQAVRAALHEHRLSQGPSAALTDDENVAIIEALTRWLEAQGEAVSHYEVPSPSARALARTKTKSGLVPHPPAQDGEEVVAPDP